MFRTATNIDTINILWVNSLTAGLKYIQFLSLAHEVGAGDIVITMSGRAAVGPCFVSGRYL